MSHYDFRAGDPVPPRDRDAFRRAKEQVDHALELRRLARAAEETQPELEPADGADHA